MGYLHEAALKRLDLRMKAMALSLTVEPGPCSAPSSSIKGCTGKHPRKGNPQQLGRRSNPLCAPVKSLFCSMSLSNQKQKKKIQWLLYSWLPCGEIITVMPFFKCIQGNKTCPHALSDTKGRLIHWKGNISFVWWQWKTTVLRGKTEKQTVWWEMVQEGLLYRRGNGGCWKCATQCFIFAHLID